MVKKKSHNKNWRNKHSALLREIGEQDFFCNGSLQEFYRKCGKEGCACAKKDDAKHGPYYILSRTSKGKRECKSLTEDQAKTFRAYNEKYRKLKDAVDEISDLVLEAIINDDLTLEKK